MSFQLYTFTGRTLLFGNIFFYSASWPVFCRFIVVHRGRNSKFYEKKDDGQIPETAL